MNDYDIAMTDDEIECREQKEKPMNFRQLKAMAEAMINNIDNKRENEMGDKPEGVVVWESEKDACKYIYSRFGALGIIEVCDNIDQRKSLGYWLAETSTHVILAAYSDGAVPCAYLKEKYTFKKVSVS